MLQLLPTSLIFGDPDPSFYIYPRDVEPLKLLVLQTFPWDVAVSSGEQWISAQRDKDTLLKLPILRLRQNRFGNRFCRWLISATLTFQPDDCTIMSSHRRFHRPYPASPTRSWPSAYTEEPASRCCNVGVWCRLQELHAKVKELYGSLSPRI